MTKTRYYSPRLERALISPLYHAAKSQRVPMTRLASALLREGLQRLGNSSGHNPVLCEPPPFDPQPR